MTSRITFLLIALFWLTMTYLLWRSEYEGHNHVGSNVPLELVWRKILTAPDASGLEIFHQKQRVGRCRWSSNIGQDNSARIVADDAPPDGMVQVVTGYRLNLQGDALFNEAVGRLTFDFDIKLASSEVWQEFSLGLKNVQKLDYKIHSRAGEKTVSLETSDRKNRWERVFKYADLENPSALIAGLGLSGAGELLDTFGPLPDAKTKTALLPEVVWTARNDWIAIGHTSVRAYRLEASLLERYRMMIIVSRVGEILRVELPDGWELINDQLLNL